MAKAAKPDEMDLDPPNPSPPSDNEEEDDPITATYPVFLNPSLPSGRRLLVLQYPNRTDEQPRTAPTELRIKPTAGMVEVDIPVDSASGAYDREKGIRWGKGLHASTAAKSGGSHGLAGGFGFGAVQQRGGAGGTGARGKKAAADALADDDMLEWNEAVRQGKALTTQTLGGQYPDSNDVQYMVGVFQGKNLHLTPVSSMVHLRPQLHHIDAATYLDKRAAGEASGASGSGAGGASSSAGAGAKAIHMTIKNTTEGDRVTTETMADRLRAVQSEPWRKMRYTDENDEAAWDVFNESLFLKTDEGGKEKEGEEADDHLESSVPRFETRWGELELLEAVSGIEKRPDIEPQAKVKPEPQPQKVEPKEPARPKATRGRGGAAGGARRGGRTKATAAGTGS